MASLLLWIPLATAVEKFSGDREGKAEQSGGKNENEGGKETLETNIEKIPVFIWAERQQRKRARDAKVGKLRRANGGWKPNTEAFRSAASEITLYF